MPMRGCGTRVSSRVPVRGCGTRVSNRVPVRGCGIRVSTLVMCQLNAWKVASGHDLVQPSSTPTSHSRCEIRLCEVGVGGGCMINQYYNMLLANHHYQP